MFIHWQMEASEIRLEVSYFQPDSKLMKLFRVSYRLSVFQGHDPSMHLVSNLLT